VVTKIENLNDITDSSMHTNLLEWWNNMGVHNAGTHYVWLAVTRRLWALKHENLLVLFEHTELFTDEFYVLKVVTPEMERF